MEVRMTAQAQWNELSHHQYLIHFSLFLLWLSLSLRMTVLMTISWEPLQNNLKRYIIIVGLKAPSLQSNSSCMSSGSSNRMIALQAPPASFASLPTGSQNNSFGLHRIWGSAVPEELQDFSKDKELAVCAAKTSSERHRMGTSRVCWEQPEGTAQAPCAMENLVLEWSAQWGEIAQSLTLLRGLSHSRGFARHSQVVQANSKIQAFTFMRLWMYGSPTLPTTPCA